MLVQGDETISQSSTVPTLLSTRQYTPHPDFPKHIGSLSTFAMEDFEAYLKTATARGANVVPGAVMAVVDKNGMSSPISPRTCLH